MYLTRKAEREKKTSLGSPGENQDLSNFAGNMLPSIHELDVPCYSCIWDGLEKLSKTFVTVKQAACHVFRSTLLICLRANFPFGALGMVSALYQARWALVTQLRTLVALLHKPRAFFGPMSQKLTHRRSESSWDFERTLECSRPPPVEV